MLNQPVDTDLSWSDSKKHHVLSRDRLALLGLHEGEGMLFHLQGL